MPNQMPIPTDWNEEEDGYALAVVCFPNSDMWRRNLRGAIYALTRGRNYDFDSGHFLTIEPYAVDLWESFMACDFQTLIDKADDLIKTQRMIVAALMGQEINFDSEPLPNAINYSQGIRQALLGISGVIGDDMTLAELKELIDNIDLTGTDFIDTLTDIAQILAFLFLVFGPDERVVVAMGWWDKMTLKRWQHNNLTIQAHQATSLRGIMRAIAPMKEEAEEEEKDLWDTVGQIPWLARAVVAIAEPSPVGEFALIATTLGGMINNVYQILREAYNIWWNKWVNLIEEPEPVDTVTAALGVIAARIATREDIANNPDVSVVNRLDVIAEALAGEGEGSLIPILTLINTAIGNLDGEPNVSEWQGMIDQIITQMGETMPIINVTCGQCGSSSGCGCGSGSGSGVFGPGVEGPDDKPPVEIVEGTIPSGFPDGPTYDTYRCKASNVLVLNLAELVAQVASMETMDLTQYSTYNTAMAQVTIKLNLVGLSAGTLLPSTIDWLSNQIMSFVWPYPNEDSAGLAIFEGIRLEWLIDRQDNVCGLYNSDNTGDARTFVQTTMDGYIDATSYSSDVKNTAKEVISGLISNQWLNRLFEKDSFINVYSDSSSIDCSLCISGNEPSFFGEDIAQDGNEWDVSSSPTSGGHYVAICFNAAANFNVSLLSGSLTEPFDFPNCRTQVSTTQPCCGGGCINACWTLIEPTHELGDYEDTFTVQYRSGLPFRVRFTVEP